MTVDEIIQKFGGIRPASRAWGIHPASISRFKKQGRIPQWRWPFIIDAGKRHGIRIDLKDLYSPNLTERKDHE